MGKGQAEECKIVIYKGKRLLELYCDGKLLRTYPIALGFAPLGHKYAEGDGKTPEGVYHICTRNEESRYFRFLGLDYPRRKDAERAFSEGRIDSAILQAIILAHDESRRPPYETPLGGAIGIHGGGTQTDWTKGCIALSDESMLELWEHAGLGSFVNILP